MAGLRGGLRQRGRLRRGLAWAALVSVVVCAEGQQATLVGDAHVSSAQPTVNAGSLSNLNVGGGYTALVQFDLGTLPAGTTAAQISRATLRVFCNRADAPGAVQVQAVGGAWTESAVTYATLPPLGATVQTAQVSMAGQFVAFDVTQAVQAWVSGAATNNGLALVGATGTVVQFDSKESDQTSHEPVLEIALAADWADRGYGCDWSHRAAGDSGSEWSAGIGWSCGRNRSDGCCGSDRSNRREWRDGSAGDCRRSRCEWSHGGYRASGAAGSSGRDGTCGRGSWSSGIDGRYRRDGTCRVDLSGRVQRDDELCAGRCGGVRRVELCVVVGGQCGADSGVESGVLGAAERAGSAGSCGSDRCCRTDGRNGFGGADGACGSCRSDRGAGSCWTGGSAGECWSDWSDWLAGACWADRRAGSSGAELYRCV